MLNSGALSRYPEEEEDEEEEEEEEEGEGEGADPPSPEELEERLLSLDSERLDELFDRKDKSPLFFFFESSPPPSSDVVFEAVAAPEEAPSARGRAKGDAGEAVPREESERGLFFKSLLEEGEAEAEADDDDDDDDEGEEEDNDDDDDDDEDDLGVKAPEESEVLLLFRRPPNSFPFLEA